MISLVIRIIVLLCVGIALGAVVTPLAWAPILIRKAESILAPFLLLSGGIFVAAVGYAWAQFRR
jgi:hypothetical protein